MKQTDQHAAPVNSFAGLMANLTRPAAQTAVDWLEEEPAQDANTDISALSYERALRRHARYRPVEEPAQTSHQAPTVADSIEKAAAILASVLVEDSPQTLAPSQEPELKSQIAIDPILQMATAGVLARAESIRRLPDRLPDKYKSAGLPQMPPTKSVSITLRVSEEEAEQLRQRAREAGLTISAYMRSCTFEAEALRLEVKEALAALRSAPNTHPAKAAYPWWIRLFAPARLLAFNPPARSGISSIPSRAG